MIKSPPNTYLTDPVIVVLKLRHNKKNLDNRQEPREPGPLCSEGRDGDSSGKEDTGGGREEKILVNSILNPGSD